MNAKRWIPLVLALVLGVIAAKLSRDAMSRSRGASTDTNSVPTVVAARDIQPGQALTAEDLAIGRVAPDSVASGSFQTPAELLERVTLSGLVKGQPVLENGLAPTGAAAGMQALIPPGMRAITVQVDEFSGLGGLLMPGCRVDIISVVRNEDDKGSVARTIVQNVLVRAIGRQVSFAAAAAASSDAASPSLPTNVTLLVTPAQAEAVQLASVGGKPWLILRNGKDAAPVESDGTSLADLRGTGENTFEDPTPPSTKLVNDPFAEGPSTSTSTSKSSGETRTVTFIRNTKVEDVTVDVPPPSDRTTAPDERKTQPTSPRDEITDTTGETKEITK